jgi:hypothetical protein
VGYTRIQGALKNLGHGVARSTVAKVLSKSRTCRGVFLWVLGWREVIWGRQGRPRA